MYDHPHADPIGPRDVIAAWLLCLAMAGVFLIHPPAAAGTAYPAVEAHALPAAPPAEICAVGKSPVAIPRG